MIYKNFRDTGIKLSSLGMGAMRFPENEGGTIDEAAATKLMERAIEGGINYFDTAYFYHSGHSENFLARTLRQFPRDRWYLTNKIPGNMMTYIDGKLRLEVGGFNMESKTLSGPAEIFQEQLEKCETDCFDFYMLHNVSETTFDLYTNEELGIMEYLVEQKKAGRIKHLGFSSHGRADTIEACLQSLEGRGMGDVMEYCMIQINYLDWVLQAAGEKYEVLKNRGLPVFVMEGVRGGKLANLPQKAAEMLKTARPHASHAEWAWRHLQSLENIDVVISGMSTMEQLEENLAIFSSREPLTDKEMALLNSVVDTLAERAPCTACQYCIAACPVNLDIPLLLKLYNEAGFEMMWTISSALRALGKDKSPAACIDCGACNPLCPQNIDIPKALADFSKLLA
ncbi:MAG: aldo/keto reductase [Clostridiales bacterium]|jgi:predicted aldo/keto reductase-like oxidoreductase|nr:aldo/keto reductase [Clostridiales bacterium]